MLFDTHAHLDDRKYNEDREEIFERAKVAGVELILNVGFDLPSSKRSIQLAEKYPFIYAGVGIHPHDAASMDEKVYQELEELAQHPRVVAIGEMGLDYYRDLSPRDIQAEVFRRQISLAKKVKKPIIIHDRDAHGDIIQIMKEEKVQEVGGVLHCFSGSWEMAKECLKLNFYISIAGPVTFSNAGKLKEIAAQVPLERLLIETDSPYLTPTPHRGKRNESAYVKHVAEEVAKLRGIAYEELVQATLDNGKRLFKIT
jgi:TatD DNase family protein